MRRSVDEVGDVANANGIDCDYAKGGTLSLIRSRAQASTSAREARARSRMGRRHEDDLRLVDAAETSARLNATDVIGGLFTPHCAAIHPAKLVRGLAELVERRGATIHEGDDGHRDLAASRRHPPWCRAGRRRRPGHRGLHANDPRIPSRVGAGLLADDGHRAIARQLSGTTWGCAQRETFNDLRHLIIYGQRTADDRLAFGGRGAPYHFGSRVEPAYDREPAVFEALATHRCRVVPRIGRRDAVTHTWGGPLGVPRDWFASVGLTAHRARMGWRLRRRRCRDIEPRGPHPRRPDHRTRHRTDGAALGQPPQPAVGARTTALAGDQRITGCREVGGRC